MAANERKPHGRQPIFSTPLARSAEAETTRRRKKIKNMNRLRSLITQMTPHRIGTSEWKEAMKEEADMRQKYHRKYPEKQKLLTQTEAITRMLKHINEPCFADINADNLNDVDLERLRRNPPVWPVDKIVLSQRRDRWHHIAYTAYTGLLPVPGRHISHQLFIGTDLTARNFNPLFLECVPPWVNQLRRTAEIAIEKLINDFLIHVEGNDRQILTESLNFRIGQTCNKIWQDRPRRPIADYRPPLWSLLYYQHKRPDGVQGSQVSRFPWLNKNKFRVSTIDAVTERNHLPRLTQSASTPHTSLTTPDPRNNPEHPDFILYEDEDEIGYDPMDIDDDPVFEDNSDEDRLESSRSSTSLMDIDEILGIQDVKTYSAKNSTVLEGILRLAPTGSQADPVVVSD